MTPRVSILLPVRDCENTLETCLRSIERQREPRFECVIVDDGSRDASTGIARAFAARDPRLRLVVSGGRGLVDALETGLRECRGELVARMDGDDWMHRDRLAAQLRMLDERPELAGVGCHVRHFPRTREPHPRSEYEAWLNGMRSAAQVRADAFVECPLAHPTWMIRREVLGAFGYRDRGWPEDYDLLLRLLGAGHELGVVPQRLLGWRDHPRRHSRTHERYGQDRFTACKAHHLAASLLAKHDRYVLWGYGDTGRTLRRALLEHGKSPAAIVELHPGRLGQRIHGAPVVAPDELARFSDLPLVASVAGPDARSQIRAHLARLKRVEGSDFVCAA